MCAGWCAGYALKFAGRLAAIGVGSTFVAIQSLSYLGYVDVNWRKAERDFIKGLDRDGDGQVR